MSQSGASNSSSLDRPFEYDAVFSPLAREEQALAEAPGPAFTPPTSSPRAPQSDEDEDEPQSADEEDGEPVVHVQYPALDRLTQQGARTALEALMEYQNSESGYSALVSRLFRYLDDDTYSTLRRLNQNFNNNLSEIHARQPQGLDPQRRPIRRLERLLRRNCDEFDLNEFLGNQPNYGGYCPAQGETVRTVVVRPCEGIPRHEHYLRNEQISNGANHQDHRICNGCRDTFWQSPYSEGQQMPSSNHQRLRVIIRNTAGFHRAICRRCNIRQKNLHPQPVDGCTCYHDVFESHWRCMRCTRVTLRIFAYEAWYKAGSTNFLGRDPVNGRLHFNRRRPYTHVNRCLCDNGNILPLNQRVTLQCVGCEKYIVQSTTTNPIFIRQSKRIRHRKEKGNNEPELGILVGSIGRPLTARVNKHGFAI